MATLFYQGHGSFRLTSDEGIVVYLDPYAGEGYDVPADLILVTHDHYDHNRVELPAKKEDTVIITAKEALVNGQYQTFEIKGIKVEAVQAYNVKHDKNQCVGYVLTVSGKTVYASGDTSRTEDMLNKLPAYHLDYALFPIDGVYNMDAVEATLCAEKVGAKCNIPIHVEPGELYNPKKAAYFVPDGRVLLAPNATLRL